MTGPGPAVVERSVPSVKDRQDGTDRDERLSDKRWVDRKFFIRSRVRNVTGKCDTILGLMNGTKVRRRVCHRADGG